MGDDVEQPAWDEHNLPRSTRYELRHARLGESEIAEGKATVKNMTSGDQELVSRNVVSERIKRPA